MAALKGTAVATHFVGRTTDIRQDNLDSGSRFIGFSADEALVGAWTRLEPSAHLPTQFYTFAASLSDTLLAETPLTLLIASTAGGASALLPLCRGKGYFARWRAIGPQELSEPVDALCADGEGAALLAQALSRQSRPLLLDRIPAASELVPALRSAMKGRGWLSVRPAVPTPTITLDESWKSPEARFNSGRRSDFRRAARRAGELGAVTYEVLCPSVDQFDALFDEAIGVEVRSWKKEAGTAIAVDGGKESFFRDFFRSASRQDIFRVAFLRIDGQAIAMQMGLECLDRYWLFKIGYDEEFGKCSPGTLLMLHTLGWAAERGLRSYELLGDVEPWIAALWTRERRECLRVRTYPFGIRGMAGFAADSLTWALARLKSKPDVV
jgi:CelD/BcsL family acetyltransferase involved in cellulose biosynthesis